MIIFQALYHGARGSGRLLEAFPELTPKDCQEMLDLLPEQQLIGKILNRTRAPKHRQDYYYYGNEEDGASA